MLMELAEIFRRNAGKPQRIQVEDAKTEALWKISVANATLFLPANKICHYLMRLGLLFWTVL